MYRFDQFFLAFFATNEKNGHGLKLNEIVAPKNYYGYCSMMKFSLYLLQNSSGPFLLCMGKDTK